MKKEYFKNIDFLRFLFAFLIIVLHFVRIGMSDLWDLPKYASIKDNVYNIKYVVEAFFVISGFFLIFTFKPAQTTWDFIKDKLIRFLPVMVFTIICFAIASLFGIVKFWPYDDAFTILLIHGFKLIKHSSPFGGLGNIHSTWFISILFWVSLFYWYLFKNFERKIFFLVTWIIFFASTFCIGHDVKHLVISQGALRGLFAIGLGCLIGLFYKDIKDKINLYKTTLVQKFGFTLLEIGSLGLFLYSTLQSSKGKLYNLDLVLIFLVLFVLFLLKKGILSRMLNTDISVLLGRYSYSMFVTHCFLLDIFQKYYFTKEICAKLDPLVALIFPLFCCMIFAVLTYHLVEKPSIKYLKNKFKKEN